MLGRQMGAPAKQRHVAGAGLGPVDGAQMPRRGGKQGLVTARFRPVRRIGRQGFRLVAVKGAPDAADQAETVAADPLQ